MLGALRFTVLLIACVAVCASSSGADDFAQRLREKRVQLELPAEGGSKGSSDERRGEEDQRSNRSTRDYDASGKSGSESSSRRDDAKESQGPRIDLLPVLEILGSVLLVVLAIVGIVAFVRWRSHAPQQALPEHVVAAHGRNDDPIPPQATSTLAIAEEFAARGMFDRAIHALLLDTLTTLVRSHARVIRPAATSREIARMLPLTHDPRTALGRLVLAVEVSHFGTHRPGREDYERCRADREFILSVRES